MKPEEKITGRIKRALENVGIGVSGVEVVDYSPEHFGNHLARVATDKGLIEVYYDRAYGVDLQRSSIPPQREQEIMEALEAERTREFRWYHVPSGVAYLCAWVLKESFLRLIGRPRP